MLESRWTNSPPSSASIRSSCGCSTIAEVDPAATPGRATACRSACARGAERFGWDKRNPTPRSERDGDWLIGNGMAAAGVPGRVLHAHPARPGALYADGSAVVQTATPEFGTGVATVMTQVAADALGLDLRDVAVRARRQRPADITARPSAPPAR